MANPTKFITVIYNMLRIIDITNTISTFIPLNENPNLELQSSEVLSITALWASSNTGSRPYSGRLRGDVAVGEVALDNSSVRLAFDLVLIKLTGKEISADITLHNTILVLVCSDK